MDSRDHRSYDQLDLLIRRTLVNSVDDEEPPARVWERVRAQLEQPQSRPALRWSGPILQAALLALVLVFGSISLREEPSIVRLTTVPAAVPSQVSPTASQVFFDSETIELQLEYSGAVMDASDVALLRQYSSEQTQILIVEELQRRAPGVVVPRNDIPPHPNSPQARVLHLTVPDHGKPVKSPAYTPGEIWQ